MRSLPAFVLATVLGLMVASCGLWVMTSQDTKPSPKSNSDKAVLVIMRTTSYGAGATISNYLDGKIIGQTKGKSYFFTEVTPGKHSLVCRNENMRPHEINFEAGKVYYLQQAIYMGMMAARTEYDTLNPQIFEEQKPECDFVVFDPALAEGEDEATVDMEEVKEERAEQLADQPDYFTKVDNLRGF
ncbi:MAG: DUF2846 domain-containing protein [Chitinispirillaceae bacterium]|nr:DUF2846 domain-containing protein [Chitinispirillaceae bacterium]